MFAELLALFRPLEQIITLAPSGVYEPAKAHTRPEQQQALATLRQAHSRRYALAEVLANQYRIRFE